MSEIQINANNSRELTIKVLLYLAKCQEQGLSPQSISLSTDSEYLYSVTIKTKEVIYAKTN